MGPGQYGPYAASQANADLLPVSNGGRPAIRHPSMSAPGQAPPHGSVPYSPYPAPMPGRDGMLPAYAPPHVASGPSRPWPEDEYLTDGGDRDHPVRVGSDWRVDGLETEDTVAHYDTIDGRVVVEASNPVHIYSPRFASVRQVVGSRAGEGWIMPNGVTQPEQLAGTGGTRIIDERSQNAGLEGARTTNIANQFRTQQHEGVFSGHLLPTGFDNSFKPYENLGAIRNGDLRNTDMARLASASLAAFTWQNEQAVQVTLNAQTAAVEVGSEGTAIIYTVDGPPGEPKLQIIKVASAEHALPGEVIDFTLRFDNVGTEVIGNVTILDNLTTRLEYVEGSAQCDMETNFSVEPNVGDSLALRWEIIDPLQPGEGGIVRFQCRVR
jgi:uncharacterized repeat protein (TIGR01451 family)